MKDLKIGEKMGSLPAGDLLHKGQGQLPLHHNNNLQNPRVPKLQLQRLGRKCQEGVEVQQDVDEVEEQEQELERESPLAGGMTRWTS